LLLGVALPGCGGSERPATASSANSAGATSSTETTVSTQTTTPPPTAQSSTPVSTTGTTSAQTTTTPPSAPDTPSTSTRTPPSSVVHGKAAAAYRVQADAICRRAERLIPGALGKPGPVSGTANGRANALLDYVVVKQEVRMLARLSAPVALRSPVAALLSALKSLQQLYFLAQQQKGTSTLRAVERQRTEAVGAARAVGVPACAPGEGSTNGA
jgi:hypothetical protein